MRSDGDQWGITESVGATALGVAVGRAIETRRADGLVCDPYAEEFVAAASRPAHLPTRRDMRAAWDMPSSYIGVRSRFFDLCCTAAAAAGITQVVILAAGLDTRALRLNWPAGSTVFEVDQARVLEFKELVLGGRRPGGAAARVAVPVDLREDWPAALCAAGFDPARPSAWLAEGLLPYLPAQAEADLFDRVHRLSPAGSRIAVEQFALTLADTAWQTARMSELLGVDLADLVYLDDREDPAGRLRRLGWSATRAKATDFAQAHGRELSEHVRVFGGDTFFVEAVRR